ncbi:glycoside hydrolase family 10 protein [Deinococcus radiophilus]|uniref:Glycoside hydrolase family 10 protein n=2 Tax=Deinococcus radiophilus TaxID=32062 RepID=A0A3S0JMQ0_9DEIO|nr:glycoside hydrolase family 10 protein [Deinococcus radiophilus]
MLSLGLGSAQGQTTPSLSLGATPAQPDLGTPLLGQATATAPVARSQATPDSTQIRGLWVDGFGPGLKTAAQVRQMVEDADRMNINTLIVQTIRRADCFCLKSSLPVVSDKDMQPGFDPLAETIRLAKPKGMKVIAWASVTGIGNLSNLNTSPNHVYRLHGPQSKDPWLVVRSDGTWQEGNDAWLDPAIPEAARYISDGLLSVVKNYDVDGIQLDRIRYPDSGDWGYSPRTLARYTLETGRTGRPGGSDEYFKAWKRDQVTGLVRRITVQAKAIKPELWVSAASITYGSPPKPGDAQAFQSTASYRNVMQDWPKWMNEGLLDINMPMNYKRENVAQQAGWYDGWNRFARSLQGRGLTASGSSIYLNSPEASAAQAQRALKDGVGWVGYSYRTPTLAVYEERQSAEAGREAVRKALAATPLGQRVSFDGPPPHTRGLMGTVAGQERLGGLKVELLQNDKVVATSVTDGGGFYGFMSVPAGETRIRVSGQAWKTTVPARGIAQVPNLVIRKLTPVSAPAPSRAPAPGTPGAPNLAPPTPVELERGGETPG